MLRQSGSMCVRVRASIRGGVFGFLSLCMVASSGFAQSKELRFEVSTIKRLGGGGAPLPNVGEVFHPGGQFRDPGTTLRDLIQTAYDFQDFGLKIVGLPKWAEDTVWVINAKAGPEYPADVSPNQNRENIKAMLRILLADRFQLKIRQEERPTKGLVLQVKQGGAKLQAVPAPVPPEKEDFLSIALGDRGGAFSGKKVTIAQMARILTMILKQPVEDRTGLTGFYAFKERWEAPRREGDAVPSDKLGPDGVAQLVSVLDQNLGLVLKPETLPVEFWVVERVEMPGEN